MKEQTLFIKNQYSIINETSVINVYRIIFTFLEKMYKSTNKIRPICYAIDSSSKYIFLNYFYYPILLSKGLRLNNKLYGLLSTIEFICIVIIFNYN